MEFHFKQKKNYHLNVADQWLLTVTNSLTAEKLRKKNTRKTIQVDDKNNLWLSLDKLTIGCFECI